ncbi:MAG: hypothetical protein MRY83_06860 [Flavobacteriales bacterium]|nr:hypothetical protein [Flavobacteriales bacterium]
MIRIILGAMSLQILLSCSNPNLNSKAEQNKTRFIVSFFSPGNGIDKEARSSLLNFLKKDYPSITYNEVAWGREGEKDYCLTLDELKSKEQLEFIRKVKELLKNSEKVNYYENRVCRKPK